MAASTDKATATGTDSTGDTSGKKVSAATVVQYIGTADVAQISAADWGNVLPDGHGATMVKFEKSNKWRVPVSDLSDDQVRYFDEDDERFVIKDL